MQNSILTLAAMLLNRKKPIGQNTPNPLVPSDIFRYIPNGNIIHIIDSITINL